MPDVPHFPAVPRLGLLVEVLGWTLVVQVRCKCDAPQVLQLVLKQSAVNLGADLGICPACGRGMHVARLTMNAHQQLEFEIGFATSTPAAVMD